MTMELIFTPSCKNMHAHASLSSTIAFIQTLSEPNVLLGKPYFESEWSTLCLPQLILFEI